MSTLTVRISEADKANLADAALRAGFSRYEDGKLTGNISLLLKFFAQNVGDKTTPELKAFLFSLAGEKMQSET